MSKLSFLTVVFAVVFAVASAPAQSVVPAGAGSFASFPPASAGGTAVAASTQSLYVVSGNVLPVPSNKWWTDLVIHQYSGFLWAYPLAVSADAQGVNIFNPDWGTYDGAHAFMGVNFQPVNPISIRGQGFAPADARALSWGDWTVAFRMQQATNQFMDVTLGHGLPYVWVQFTGVQPQIVSSTNATYFRDDGGAQTFPVTTNHLGITYGGRSYGVFAPDNTAFTLSNGNLNVTFAGSNAAYLVVGALPAVSNLAYFAQYAYALPTNSVMNWTYDPNAATVTTSWHLATQVLNGSQTNTIQGWIPHHWRNTNNFIFNGIQYNTTRGLMKCTVGADYQIVYKFNGIPPSLPAPSPLGLTNDFVPSRMNSYITSVAANTAVAADTYSGGKDMLRYAQHMVYANLLGRPEFTTLENTLRTALANWFTYSPGSDADYFARYPAWGALVGFPAGYGSDQLNDQHFHYGYFAHVTALLGMYDHNFLTNYAPMTKLVAKEYANWDRSDTNFPFMRTFDIWAGYSQASGFSDPIKGNNQESSSEAMQSWGGLFLLGSMLADDQMRAAGAMGYAMESEGVRQYYFNVPKFYNASDSNWPISYTKSIVGILWGSGQECQTYFGGNPIYIHAIQWLPPSPIMSYQVEDPAFAQYDYNNMLSEQGSSSIGSLGSEWGNYALSYAAQFNPAYSAAQMDQLWAANDPVATDVTYAGVTYYQTHALRKLGAIQWQYHISVPTSAVYYNTNTSLYTYVAFNPLTTTQVATIYSNQVAVGTMVLPPLALTVQSIPPVPAYVTAVAGNTQVVVNWAAATGATSYNVLMGTTPGVYAVTNTTTLTSYTNAGLANGTTYYFVVQAANPVGISGNSAQLSATPNFPLAAPTGLTAIAQTNQVALSWNTVAGAGSYNVKRSTASGAEVVVTNVTASFYADAGLAGGVTYYYVVSAVNTVDGTNSMETSATTVGVPASPTGLTATAGITNVSLNWTASATATGYNVKRSAISGAETTLPAGANVPGTTFTDNTVTVGTNYYYQVSALNGYGQGASSAEVSAVAPGLPSAYEPFNYPLGANLLNGTATKAAGFTGNWTCSQIGTLVAGLTYPGLPATNNALQVSIGKQQESLASPVSSGSVYISYLYNESGNPGGQVNGLTLLDGSVNGLMLGFSGASSGTAGYFGFNQVTGGSGGANVWQNSSLGTYGTTYFIVVELTYAAGTVSSISIWINPPVGSSSPGAANGTVTSYGFGALSAIGTYYTGSASSVVDEVRVGTTYGEVAGYVATQSVPSAPTNVTATAGNAQVVVSWSAVSGATNYNVLQGTNSGNYVVTNTTSLTSYTNAELANGTTYYFVLQAANPVGTSTNSTQVSATPSVPLTAPTGLTAIAQTNQVLLNWNATSGATGYNVGRSTTAGAETTIATTAATNYTDATAVGGTAYYYVVSATNSAGGSPNSLEVSTTPLVAVPGAPTGLTATATNGQVTLVWSRAAGAASYNVKRSITSGSGYTTVSSAGTVTGTNYMDATVTNGTTYYYVVSATNSAGESINSAQVSALPKAPPSAPAGVTATAGTNQVFLNWTASSGANSYNVKRSATSGSGYVTISTPGTVTGTNYTDATVTGGTTNYYVVSAVSAVYGEGANSAQVSATPTAAAASAGLTAYEPFHYSTGSLANGIATTATGFSSNWTCGTAGTIVTGLAYAGLPATYNAFQSSSSRQSESLTNPISSGTNWISFLFQSGTGNSGGNANGVFFPNGGGACLWFGFGLNPSTPTQGYLGLGSMAAAGTSALGATNLAASYLGTYGSTYLVVLEIIYNGSGASTNISCWINPPATSSAPGTAATMTNTTFNAGTISGVGLNVQGAGSITVDEVRVGTTYGDVVGYVAPPSAPGAPTGVAAAAGNAQIFLSWNAATGATNYNVLQGTNSGAYNVTNTTTQTSYTNTGLANGTTYYFVVQAAGAGGVSTNTTQVSATPTGGGTVSATVSVTSSNVTVTYVGTPGSGYVVERTTNLVSGTGLGWVPISTNTAPTNGMFQVIDLYPDLGGIQPKAAFYRSLSQ